MAEQVAKKKEEVAKKKEEVARKKQDATRKKEETARQKEASRKHEAVDIGSRSIRKRSRPSTETISANKKQNTSVDNNAELDDAEIHSTHSDEFENHAVFASTHMKKTSWNKQGISGFNVYAKDGSMKIAMKRSRMVESLYALTVSDKCMEDNISLWGL